MINQKIHSNVEKDCQEILLKQFGNAIAAATKHLHKLISVLNFNQDLNL